MTAAAAPRSVAPPDAAAVAAVLHDCAREGAAVVAHGGGTLQAMGNAPRRYDVALALRELRRIREYDPREMTVSVDAGMPIAAFSRALEEAGQFVPFDVPDPERATIGGTLSAGWIGPRRAVYGRPRDLLIGSTVALADGTLAHAGGMVVKNVTGYDMSKLYVGALGTLGVIVRANFKALPRPAVRRVAVAPLPEDARERSAGVLAAIAPEPSAILIVDGFAELDGRFPGPARAVVLLEGSEAVVERSTRELRSALGRAGVAETVLHDGPAAKPAFAAIVDRYIASVGERSVTYRSLGLPGTAAARVRHAAAIAAAHDAGIDAIADLRTGDAILRFVAASEDALCAVIPALDAGLREGVERAILIAGGAAARSRIDAWGAPPTTIASMRALKARFDPAGILAPGRYVGGI